MSALRLVLIPLLVWLTALPALAQSDPIIVTWNTAGGPHGGTLDGTVSPAAPGLTQVALQRNNVSFNDAVNAFNSRSWPQNSDATRFLSWGFDATVPHRLTELVIRLQRSTDGPQSYRIDISIDGGTFAPIHSGTLPAAATLVPVTVDLADAPVNTSVRFRLHAWNRQSANGTLRVQNAAPADDPAVDGRGIVIRGHPALAELEAGKHLMVFSEGGAGCGDLTASPPAEPENPAAIPGACIQYVISVTNSGPVAAQDVSLTDPIPVNLTLRTAQLGPGWMAGTLGFTPDCTGTGCSVQITGGVISAGTTATLAIRATVN